MHADTRPRHRRAPIARLAPVVALLAASGAAIAQSDFTYSGRLTDAGAPAEGLYDFRFTIQTDPTADAPLTGTLTRTGVEVAGGVFTVDDLNFAPDNDLLATSFADKFLQIEVRPAGGGAYTELLPRQRFNGVPVANELRGFAVERDFSTAGATLRTFVDGETAAEWGASDFSETGFLKLYDPATGTATVSLEADFSPLLAGATGLLQLRSLGGGGGGRIALLSDAGNETFSLTGGNNSPGISMFSSNATFDLGLASSNGGVLEWTNGAEGLSVDFSTPGDPELRFFGNGKSVLFNLGGTGDAAVDVPDDSISDDEILDEPGVANRVIGGLAVEPTVADLHFVVASQTIDCPTSGYVLAVATCQLDVQHTSGFRSRAGFAITRGACDGTGTPLINVRIPENASTGEWEYPVSLQGVFSVSAGENFFCFTMIQEGLGFNAAANDANLSLVFIPTAYGTINAQ